MDIIDVLAGVAVSDVEPTTIGALFAPDLLAEPSASTTQTR
jgi:hypothetical protein